MVGVVGGRCRFIDPKAFEEMLTEAKREDMADEAKRAEEAGGGGKRRVAAIRRRAELWAPTGERKRMKGLRPSGGEGEEGC